MVGESGKWPRSDLDKEDRRLCLFLSVTEPADEDEGTHHTTSSKDEFLLAAPRTSEIPLYRAPRCGSDVFLCAAALLLILQHGT